MKMQMMALEDITPSPNNPRRAMEKTALAELVQSVKTHGVLQPVLVRPFEACEHGQPTHELVCGHRRYAAAKAAGLTEIPCTIRTLSETEARELMLVENVQRIDLHALEEAETYHQLHEKHGYEIDALAAKAGKSRAYVYARIKLCTLAGTARKLFLEDAFDASVALIVSRVPAGKLQDAAAREVASGRYGVDRPMTYREALEHVERNYMLELGKAPFDPKDVALMPAAGACTNCPKRTGNQKDLFGDIKGSEICTDPTCYRSKLDAFWEASKRDAVKTGIRVLSDKECRQLWPHAGSYMESKEFVTPSDSHMGGGYGPSGYPTYQKLAKGSKPEVVLARHPKTGDVVKLWKKNDVLALARKSGTLAKYSTKSSASTGKKKAGRWEPAGHEVYHRSSDLAVVGIVQHLEKKAPANMDTALRVLASMVTNCDLDEVAKRRGLVTGKTATKDAEAAIVKELKRLKGRPLFALVAELVISDCGGERDVCKSLGLKFADFEKAARKQLIAEHNAKSSGKKSAGKKSGAKSPADEEEPAGALDADESLADDDELGEEGAE